MTVSKRVNTVLNRLPAEGLIDNKDNHNICNKVCELLKGKSNLVL